MKTKLTTIFKKSANTPPMWVCLLFALVISTNCWGDVTVTWGSYSGDNSLPSTPNVSAVNGLTLSSNMSVGDLVGHPTYRFTADNTQYVDISVGSDFFISNVETSILYDGGGDGRLYIQFCTSETYFDGNKKGDPIELLDLVSWGEWNTANPPLRSVSSVEENVKSARIYRVGANTYGTNLYRIRVSAVVDLSTKDDAELALTVTEKSIPVGGTFNIGVSTADGYDGEISYSVSPSGVVNLNESTGVVTGTAMGEATISVTASTTENYVGTTETCTVHVIKNFAGTLTASKNGGNVTLEWFYNLPISLANDADPVKCGDNNEASYTSSTYANGVRTITYNTAGGTYYYCKDFKTSLNDAEVPNCKSFSFEYKGGGNNGTNARIVPYTWVHRPEWAAGDLVADPVSISSEWQEATVTPAYYWDQCGDDIKGNDLNDYSYYDYPVGCVAFCPMADDVVSGGTLQLRNAYFQIINTNGLTSSVKLVRKDGSAPADASDGTSIYTGAPTTYVDNSGLAAGHTYYYRLFVTYNDVEYASNAVSITMPGVAKKDPELSLPASSAVLKEGDTYTLEPTVASGYDGTLAYEITAGSDKISLSGSTITAEAAGTATVRVTAPETTEYNQVTANFTVTVLAVPETNLAIKNVDGDNVTLTWDVPGKIDLSKAKNTSKYLSTASCYAGITYASDFSLNNNEELDVTYSVDHGGVVGVLFDVNLTSVESISFEYKGDYTGDGWDGIFPAFYNYSDERLYWEGGSHSLAETSWTSKTISPSNYLWCWGSSASGNMKELGFFANLDKEGASLSNAHMYLRNVFYHCTGMTDIDHIVIMRTTSAEATDTVSGTKIYSGKMSHFVDTESKAAGLYYYTLFAVYANGCIPVEYVTLDNRSFSITYKDKGDAEFSGTHETGYPTTHSNAAATALKKATKEDYIFVGWYDNAACTGDAITSLAAGAYDADITLYARWEQLSLHQPGKYQAPTSEGGYGRVLKNKNSHDYEVYLVTYDEAGRECESGCDNKNGELYAGPVDAIHDGYRMFTGSANTEAKSADGWVAFKPYKYYGDAASSNYDEFQKLNANSSISSSRYARIGEGYYVHLYVQGYDQFAFVGQDNSADNHFVIRIDGIQQAYTPDNNTHVTRYDLTTNEPHFIEITGSTSNTNSKFRGFSLRLQDVERYTVTIAKNDNSYGAVSAASIANVRTGEATYVSDNTLYIAGTTVTATPTESNAQYSYAFNNWTVGGSAVPATITAATTITANFTRTAEEYTLTWDLNGGTVTTAGTGAEMDATGTPSSSVAYGTAITAPVVEKNGYEFIGWDVTPAATMPAEAVTYTAQWFTPEHISSACTTTLNHANVRTVVNNTNPHNPIVSFDADNNGEAETCLNLEGSGSATWKAYITRGYYQARVIYGTTSGGVNIKLQVIDPETSGVVVETGQDKHTESGVKHCLAIWGLDLRGNDIDENKVYEIKVVDVHGAGSKPYISSVNITPMAIPNITSTAVTHLDYTNVIDPNKISILDLDQDSNIDTCLLIGGNKHTDWRVTLKNKGKYFVRVMYGKESGGTTLRLHVFDKNGNNVFTHPEDRSLSSSVRYETWTWSNVDLSDCTENEEYIIRIEDSYNGTGSKPNIAYLEIKSETVYIPTETRLDAENSISALNFATDLDIDDDGNNDKLMNLKNSTAEWMAQITPGVYNVSLIYGVPAWGIEVSVKLIDPTGEEEERYLSTNPSYYQSAVKDDNEQQLPHHHVGTTLCDLTGLTPGKKYKVQVADEWDDGCNLRVSHVLFTPIEPVAIPTERRLDITNTISSPTMATDLDIDGDNTLDELMNLNQNKGNAEWIVKITQGIYDVKLTYGAPEFSIRVVAKLIDPSGEEADRYLSADPYYYESGAENVPHYHTSTTRCDFSSITEDKIYKVVIEDAYGGTYGCELRVSHLEFARPVDTYTRTGLTVGNYGTICLPYAVAAEDIHGADIFDMQGWPAGSVAVVLNEVDNMVAGRPYVIQAKATTATWSYYPEGDPTDAGTHNGLIGSYDKEVIPANANNYMVYKNKLYYVDVLSYVGINKAYINRTLAEEAAEPVAPAPGKRQIRLFLDGEQVITDIDQINDQMTNTKYMENGILYILREGKVYNAQGQLVK